MRKYLIFCLLFFSIHLFAQNTNRDSIRQLSPVNINAVRLNDFSIGLKVDKIDTITLNQYSSSSLSDILITQTPIYIKTYGQGGLASISFRGTSSNHTGIFWNGFNINSPNLGMTDISLIPVFFFKSIEIQHGGISSVYGSGNIGGSIHLTNNPVFKNYKKTDIGFSIGSFNDLMSDFKFTKSNKKWHSTTGVIIHKLKNNYKFINTEKYGKPYERLQNGELFQYGIIQELSKRLSKSQFLKASVWYQHSKRQIPPTMTMSSSNAYQIDRTFRSSIQWKKYLKKASFVTRAAFMDEFLRYVNDYNDYDISNDIDSRFYTKSVIAEIQFKKNIRNHIELNVGSNTSINICDTKAYEGVKYQKQLAAFASLVKDFPKFQWSYNINIYKELIDDYKVPFSPSIGLQGKIWNFIYAKLNVSRNYRVPTLNDRYWQPGANENLKPEKSLNQESSIIFKFNKNQKIHYSEFSFTLYNSLIDDWILWYPFNGDIWKPENIQKVWARGAEIQGKTKIKCKKLLINISEAYTYSKSTNQKKISDNDNAYKKQLIYVPEHKAFITLRFIYSNIILEYNQTFTGKTYVTRDNKEYLKGYSLSNIKLSKRFNFKKKSIKIQFHINNLLNKNYQSIQYYPMPGRAFKISVNFNLK